MAQEGFRDAAPGVSRPHRWARDLEAVVERARRLGELDRAYWMRSDGGELALLPPGIDEGRFVAAFVGEIRTILAGRNAGARQSERLRLRIALHQGITCLDDHGFSGRAVLKVTALRDCAALRAELLRRPGADLAVAVSAELYDDVVEHDYPQLRGQDFRRARVGLAAGHRTDIWLHTVAASPCPPAALNGTAVSGTAVSGTAVSGTTVSGSAPGGSATAGRAPARVAPLVLVAGRTSERAAGGDSGRLAGCCDM